MEILAGFLLLGVSGIQYGYYVLPHGSFLLRAAPLALLAAFLLLRRGIGWLPQHYLVPREGYVEHLPEAGYIEVEKTFRGKYPLTICRLSGRGRQALDEYRRIIKGAL